MLKIPVVIGKNHLRGNATGAMVDDGPGEDNLAKLRDALRTEARQAGVEPTPGWLNNSVRQLLVLFEEAHAKWLADKQDTMGCVFEAALPSGLSVLMGDRRVLALTARIGRS